MTSLNPTSKRANGYLWSMRYAMRTDCNSLYKAYKNPSYNKVQAFNNIQRRMYEQGLRVSLYVISHNCHYFSTAYVDGNDIIVDTPTNTYRITDGMNYL